MTNSAPAYDFDPAYPPITVIEGTVDETVVNQFMHAHFNVIARLAKGEEHFLRPRTKTDIISHLRHQHAIVAAWSGDRIVGKLLFTKADGDGLKNMDDYPFEIMPRKDTIVLQAVGVVSGAPKVERYDALEGRMSYDIAVEPYEKGRNGWRGGELATRVVQAACAEASQQGRKWVLGKTAEDNPAARRVFEKAGFKQVGPIAQRGNDTYASLFMARQLPWRPKVV